MTQRRQEDSFEASDPQVLQLVAAAHELVEAKVGRGQPDDRGPVLLCCAQLVCLHLGERRPEPVDVPDAEGADAGGARVVRPAGLERGEEELGALGVGEGEVAVEERFDQGMPGLGHE